MLRNQVHLVHEDERLCRRRVGLQSVTAHFEVVLIAFVLLLQRLDFHHVNQHLHILENVIALRAEVILHERFLTAAVPQIQHQRAHETHMRMFDIDGGTQATRVTGNVIGKYYGPHRRLAAATFAHQ